MLTEGKKAPSFSMPSSLGGTLSLAELKGKVVVLYFYPKDDTPGCTIEANDFQAALPVLESLGAVVLGVSKDAIASHCKFADKYGLSFPLLADVDGKAVEAYGAWGEKSMYGKKSMGIVRTTVVIGPDGNVHKVFPKVKVAGHVDEILQTVRSLSGLGSSGTGRKTSKAHSTALVPPAPEAWSALAKDAKRAVKKATKGARTVVKKAKANVKRVAKQAKTGATRAAKKVSASAKRVVKKAETGILKAAKKATRNAETGSKKMSVGAKRSAGKVEARVEKAAKKGKTSAKRTLKNVESSAKRVAKKAESGAKGMAKKAEASAKSMAKKAEVGAKRMGKKAKSVAPRA